MELTITNAEGLSHWMHNCRTMNHDLKAIKGSPPEFASYSDGSPITRPVNIAWKDTTTGEIYAIEYAAARSGE